MFRKQNLLSTIISVLLHSLFLLPVILMYSAPYVPGSSVIEIGFGDGKPAGGGGNNSPVKSKDPLSIPKKTEDVIPLKKNNVKTEEKKTEEKKVSENEGTETGNEENSGSGTGKGSGTGSGTGNGTGTGSGSGLGIPPPKVEKSNVYLVAVEQMPELLGGIENVQSKIPQSLRDAVNGTVYVLAYIDEGGVVRKVLLSKGLGSPYDEAALTAVKRTRFRAGRLKGEPVKVQMHISIPF